MGDLEAAIHILRLPDTRQAWDRYGLEQIWLMVRDEDGNDSYAQVAAWYRMGRLCTDQADQLQKALDQLMIKWPPNPGSAAEAFKLTVEEFILSLRDSAAAAQANDAPLIAITRVLSDAKDAIGQLRQQRIANEKAEHDWNARAMARFEPPPPRTVEPGWRDAIDRQARDIMHATDVAIGQAATQFRSPTKFLSNLIFDPRTPIDPNDHDRVPRRAVQAPAFDPPEPLPFAVAPDHWSSGDELDPVSPVLDGDLPQWGQRIGDGGLGTAGTFIDTPAGRVLAPGGVIGVGRAPAGDGTRNATGETSASPGRGSAGMPGMVAPPFGRGVSAQTSGGGTRSGGRRRRRTDPDDPWVPPPGGPSVLESAPEPDYFDPGPNVIGIDR